MKPPIVTTGKKVISNTNNSCCVDKSTNTNTAPNPVDDGTLLQTIQPNDPMCAHISITDEFDNVAREDHGVIKNITPKTDLTFGDLGLQCMCSDEANDNVSSQKNCDGTCINSNLEQSHDGITSVTDAQQVIVSKPISEIRRSCSVKVSPSKNTARLKSNRSMDNHDAAYDCSLKSSLNNSESPVTPSPTVSTLSFGGNDVTLGDTADISSQPSQLGLVSQAQVHANTTSQASSSADNEGDDTVFSAKRSKTEPKFLNDRSKYTKEVSV